MIGTSAPLQDPIAIEDTEDYRYALMKNRTALILNPDHVSIAGDSQTIEEINAL